MGSVSPQHDIWELSDHPFLPPRIQNMWKVWKSLLLWTTGLFDLLISCACGPAFHTSLILYTGPFRPPVGRVGNRGHSRLPVAPFSKSPEMHNRNLENSPLAQLLYLQAYRQNSHFSSRTTGTTVFVSILFTHTHPHPSQRNAHPFARTTASPSITPARCV